MVIVIRGRRHWLWRAVDNEGEVLNFSRAIPAEREGCVEINAKTSEETGSGADPDYNR